MVEANPSKIVAVIVQGTGRQWVYLFLSIPSGESFKAIHIYNTIWWISAQIVIICIQVIYYWALSDQNSDLDR